MVICIDIAKPETAQASIRRWLSAVVENADKYLQQDGDKTCSSVMRRKLQAYVQHAREHKGDSALIEQLWTTLENEQGDAPINNALEVNLGISIIVVGCRSDAESANSTAKDDAIAMKKTRELEGFTRSIGLKCECPHRPLHHHHRQRHHHHHHVLIHSFRANPNCCSCVCMCVCVRLSSGGSIF